MMESKPVKGCLLMAVFILGATTVMMAQSAGVIEWGQKVLVNNVPVYADAGKDARGISPGKFIRSEPL